MSLITTGSADISEAEKVPAKPKKTREERLQNGSLILTHKLSAKLVISLKVQNLLGRFEIITHPSIKEHLPDSEKTSFHLVPDIEKLPINGIVEVWTSIPGSSEYTTTEYKKLK